MSWKGTPIQDLSPDHICRDGIIQVPEGRKLFARMTVEENLEMGAYLPAARSHAKESRQVVFEIFPRLNERRRQIAGSLSGGEQQMVAIGRGLMSNPQILMLDEPSLGLMPILVDEVLDTVRRLKREGITILLVEQNVREALDLADRGYILQTGRVIAEGTGKELLESDVIRSAFLGI